MSAPATDFATLMPKVAPLLLGTPNEAMSNKSKGRLRFGTHGSMEIDTGEGWFSDHETKASGGVLELIQHKRGCNLHGALSWLEEQGLKERSATPRADTRVFYDYRDASGALAYRVERRGKDAVPPFLQHGPDGNGGFRSARGCMQGVAPLPYRLPELLAADPDAIVFVCEGEKDVDRLVRDELTATTNSGGAGKFGAALAQHFTGSRVVVLADNDKAGEDHARDVEAKLRGVAAAVAVLRLPDLPPKGDVSDWLRANGAFRNSTLDLVNLAEAALALPGDEDPAAEASAWPALDLARCSAEKAPERQWLIDGWVPSFKATLLAGDGGVGKSLLAQIMATCVALGLPFMGVETRQAVAAYASWEDDADELWRRQEAICAAMGIRLADLAGKLHLLSYTEEASPFLVAADPERGVAPTRLGRALEEHVSKRGIGFLVLDNASQIAGIDHNAVEDVAPFAHWLGTLAKRGNGAVVLLHHTNKAGQDYLGSVAYNNQFRARLLLARPADCRDPDVRAFTNPKANDARAGNAIELRWHKGSFVREEDLPASVRDEINEVARGYADDAAFLACLAERTRQQQAVSEKVSSTYAPKVFADMPESKRIGKERLEAAMQRLFRRREIERALLPWQRDRKDVFGLRQTCADACADAARTGCADAPDLSAPTGHDTHSPLKGKSGAALEASAPLTSDASERWRENPALGRARDLSRTVFPAADDDEYSAGWGGDDE